MKLTLKKAQEMMDKNGGYLDLEGTQITSLPDNLTVGGYLDLEGTQITNSCNYKQLSNGDYVEGRYLYADMILTHIKSAKKIKGYTYYIGKIKDINVISDGKNYAHCKNFKDGVSDLEFKNAKDRGAEQYKKYKLESVVPFEEAKTMYRIITGACKQGTDNFISGLKEIKESYTISEYIKMTKGQYMSEVFERFFKA